VFATWGFVSQYRAAAEQEDEQNCGGEEQRAPSFNHGWHG
jgi:hypothetical protein